MRPMQRERRTSIANGPGGEGAVDGRRPSISVIVRTLGEREGRLGEALESLSWQNRQDFEVVVVDMSDGRVEETLASWARRLPSLRRVAPRRRLNRPAALNAGITFARAPHVSVLDDDNLYDPPHLDGLVRGLETSGADLVYTGVRHATYTPEGRFVSCRTVDLPFDFDRLILTNYVYATGSAYRRATWEKLGGYDERFGVFEDWEFILRAARYGKVVHLPQVSGESRKFTGRDGVSSFDLEVHAVRACQAGVYWKHRDLYRGELRRRLKAVAAAHCRGRHPPRTGLLAHSVGGWRIELGWDLLCWWWRNLVTTRTQRIE